MRRMLLHGVPPRAWMPILLFLAACAQAATGAAPQAAAKAFVIDDSRIVALAWNLLFGDSAAPAGEYAVVFPADPEPRPGMPPAHLAHLLRDGTEVGRMERAAWYELAARHGGTDDPGGSRADGSGVRPSAETAGEGREVPLFWKAGRWDAAALLERAEWPAGLSIGVGSHFGALHGSKPQMQRDIDIGWDQKIFGHYLLGASLHRTQFGGGLTREAEAAGREPNGAGPVGPGPEESDQEPEFWGQSFWWWTVSAGIPGLRYTLSLADRPLPLYYWLEPRAGMAARGEADGRLVKQWKPGRLERPGNLAHTFEARFAALRYGLLIDTDAYRVPVHTVDCDDLPALFGRWGAGLVIAADAIATRMWIDFPDAVLTVAAPEDWPTRVRVAFLHLEFAFRDRRSFSLGLSVRVGVENPVMDRPRARS